MTSLQMIRMLAVVVVMFAVLWMPYRVYVVYNSFARWLYDDLWFLLLCRLMVYINSAINPFLYNALSVKFRRAFLHLFVREVDAAHWVPQASYHSQVSHRATLRTANGTSAEASDASLRQALWDRTSAIKRHYDQRWV